MLIPPEPMPEAPPTLARCGTTDLMSRYITLTAQLCEGRSATQDLIRQRAMVRDAIIDRLGLTAGMAFINEVAQASRR